MKKLQVALDLFSTEKALEVLEEIGQYADIIELGTPLMIAEGVRAVKAVKAKYPEKIIFADIKVMDGGSVIPKIAFEAGADMISVLAAADDATVKSAIASAREYGKAALVDMCSIKDIAARGKEVDVMKPDYVCVHVGYDIQDTGVDPIEELRKLDGIRSAKAIAGGINIHTFENAVKSPADVIIVGGGLYNQPNMAGLAKRMYEMIRNA